MVAWTKTGTVTVTNGSQTVTGAGTNFIDELREGDGFVGPDTGTYEVLNIISNTQLTLGKPYRGATAAGQAYDVMPIQGYLQRTADTLRALANEAEVLMTSPSLTAIAALNTAPFGRNLLTLVNAEQLRTQAGLDNVDNTSDLDKPVPIAVQSALDAKVSRSFLDLIGVTGPIARPVPNDDCNQAVTEGWWNATSGAAINRPPDMDYALIYVVTANSGFIVQNALDLLTGRRAGRSFNANISTWGAWGRELSPADFGTAAFENWSDLGTAAFAALATSTTDSTAGRVLRVGDHGVGGDVPYLGSPDLNNLSVPNGDYFVATPTNSPVSYGMLSHRVRSGEVYQRIASMGTAVLRTFERTKANSSPNWGSWVETTPSGIGQSWQAVSRALGTTYTNSTGRTIYITALVGTAAGQNQAISVQIAGVTLAGAYTAAAGQWLQIPPTPVPPGAAYALVPNGAGQPGTLNQWQEYR